MSSLYRFPQWKLNCVKLYHILTNKTKVCYIMLYTALQAGRSRVRFPMGFIKGNVKCTLVQALRLCTGRTAGRESRVIALTFLDHGTRSGWGVSVTPRPLFTPGKDPVPIVQEAGWAPGPVWTDPENLAPTGIRSPDRSARSHSLYRLIHWRSFITLILSASLWSWVQYLT
jgi:hypothetical protein